MKLYFYPQNIITMRFFLDDSLFPCFPNSILYGFSLSHEINPSEEGQDLGTQGLRFKYLADLGNLLLLCIYCLFVLLLAGIIISVFDCLSVFT